MITKNATNWNHVDKTVMFTYTEGDGKEWWGRMPAKQQREVFGIFLGKGTLHIDLLNGRVDHFVKVCFGTDSDITKTLKLNTLELIDGTKY